MIVLVFKYLIPKGFRGITLFPFIILFSSEDKHNYVLLNHEKIHIRQQLELLILPFFLWYFFEYLYRWIQFKDKKKAYLNISFEREAYANEKNILYLKNRYLWHFLKYYRFLCR